VKVRDVMSTDVVAIEPTAGLKEAARKMIDAGVSGLPVLDPDGTVVGIITEADFVEAEADRAWGNQRRRLLATVFGERKPREGTLVADAMSRNPICIDMDSDISEAARKMSQHGVKRLPVVDPEGRLEGIVSRADIVAAFARPDSVIADEIRHDVVERILLLDPAVVDVDVTEGIATVSGTVPNRSDARILVELVHRLEGVIAVRADDLGWEFDDTRMPS